ncbi:IS3 family transposase [Salisediminibacterium selenitireducens]
MRQVFEELHDNYGYPRITKALQKKGVVSNIKK